MARIAVFGLYGDELAIMRLPNIVTGQKNRTHPAFPTVPLAFLHTILKYRPLSPPQCPQPYQQQQIRNS